MLLLLQGDTVGQRRVAEGRLCPGILQCRRSSDHQRRLEEEHTAFLDHIE